MEDELFLNKVVELYQLIYVNDMMLLIDMNNIILFVRQLKDEKQTFCTKWMDQILEDDYLCYDITSVSSYSELNEYIKYGHNRDKEKLPQLNLAMLFGQKGRLPVYFHQLPGNITDVTTLSNLLKTFKFMVARPIIMLWIRGSIARKTLIV